MQVADSWGERLPRRVGLLSAVAVLVGTAIGSGIFRVPALVAGYLGSPGPVLVAWVLGGVVALAGALSVAELAAALPRSGGLFAYILEAFGPLPAFLFGWTELAIVRAAALGGIATVFAEYLGNVFHLPAEQVHTTAAVAVIAVGLLNYFGVQLAAVVMNMTTVAKFGTLVGLGVLAFVAGQGSAANFTPAWQGPVSGSLLFTALISIMWTYDGWADVSFMGGEIKNPARLLPLALAIGTGLIVVVYLLLNAAYIYLVPVPDMAGAPLIAAVAAERIPVLGSSAAAVISVLVMVSAFGALNGSMMTGPRVFFAMADRGLFFSGIARVSPRFRTPSVAIGLATGLGVVFVLFQDFQQLAERFILGIWPFYALSVAAVFVLRRTRPDLVRPYRAWGYPFMPLIFLAASLAMVLNALWTDPVGTGVTLGMIVAGVPVYWVWKRWGRGAVRSEAVMSEE